LFLSISFLFRLVKAVGELFDARVALTVTSSVSLLLVLSETFSV